VYDLLRRQGYSDGDATALVTALTKTDRDTRRRSVESQARSQMAKYWETGILTEDDYRALLVQHGLDEQEAVEAVRLSQVDRAYQRARRVITFVHRRYIAGAVDRGQALALLHQAGVMEPQAGDYINDWQIEVVGKHREISAAQAIKLACQGLISLPELIARLTNLGYDQDDVRVLSAEAIQCASERASRLAAQAARNEKQRQNDLIKAQRQAAQAITQARPALSRHGSPKQLRTWYCEGLVGQAEV